MEIKVGEERHEIESRPITLIIPAANMAMAPPIKYPGRVVLDPETTIYHAERVQKLHPDFHEAWNVFMSNTNPVGRLDPVTPDEVCKMGSGAKHILGLIDLTLKLSNKGVPVTWKYPESFLHPGWQVALGDLVIYFSNKYK